MAVYKGSRYERSYAGRVTDSDGVVKPVLFRAPIETSLVGAAVHQVVQGERLEHLAHAYYGAADLWWVIADANLDLLLPDPLEPGTILRIPRGTAAN